MYFFIYFSLFLNLFPLYHLQKDQTLHDFMNCEQDLETMSKHQTSKVRLAQTSITEY